MPHVYMTHGEIGHIIETPKQNM